MNEAQQLHVQPSKLGWWGLIFVIGGLGSLSNSLVAGLAFIIAGAIFLPPVNTFLAAKWDTRLSTKAKWITAILALAVGGAMTDTSNPEVTINGNTAYLRYTIDYADLDNQVWQLAQQVYKVADKNEELTKITVSVYLSKNLGGGLSDKYGNAVENDLFMGTFSITDLNEVRRYKNAATYSISDEKTMVYKLHISKMKYANMLK